VLQVDRHLRLVDEARHELAIRAQVRQHLLDDDQLLEAAHPVACEKDLAHASAAQSIHQQVAAEDSREGVLRVGCGRLLQAHSSAQASRSSTNPGVDETTA
jgi:hypothetical protein